MAIYKNIFLRPDCEETETHVWANIHYLQGYTAGTLNSYRKMAQKLRKALPMIEIEEGSVRCTTVIESDYCKQFSAVCWDGLIPKDADYPGWTKWEASRRQDYYLA